MELPALGGSCQRRSVSSLEFLMSLRPLRRSRLLAAAPVAVAGLLAGGLVLPSTQPATAAESAGGERVFVWYDEGASGAAARAKALGSAAVRASDQGRVPATESIPVPAGRTAAEVASDLRHTDGVRFAIPDLPVRRAALAPDALSAGTQWGLRNDGQTIDDPDLGVRLRGRFNVDVDAPEAWRATQGKRSTIVGIVDSGVDIGHPDLAPAIWTNPEPVALNPDEPTEKDVHGWDFCHQDGSVYDPKEYYSNGGVRELNDLHGTHVAGTVAAANDAAGSVGVAPGVTIMPLKVFGVLPGGEECGSNEIFQALVYAALHGVDVVNASWTIDAADAADRAEIDALLTVLGEEYDMVVVAAAGNAGYGPAGTETPVDIDAALEREAAGRATLVPYPASSLAENVITVGAADNQGLLAPFSNYGSSSVDILAPGVSIWSTVPGVLSKGDYAKAYAFSSGTSMAVPHVAGQAALLHSVGKLPAHEVVRRILRTGKPLRSIRPLRTVTNDLANPYRSLRPGSEIRVDVAPPSVRLGRPAVVTATLRDAVTWKGRALQQVVPCLRTHGKRGWECGRPLRTDARGRAVLRIRPDLAVDVRFRYRGATGAPATTSAVSVVGLKRAVSVRLSDATVRTGGMVRLSGRVTDTRGGETVLLQRLEGGRWRTLLRGEVTGASTYRFTVRLSRKGVNLLKVVVPPAEGFTASASSPRALRVR